MDLKVFYQKLRKLEREIAAPHVVVISLETDDGGRPGVKTEVGRESAAKLIIEGRARLATADESREFYDGLKAAMREQEREQMRGRLNVNILSDEEVQALRRPVKKHDQ